MLVLASSSLRERARGRGEGYFWLSGVVFERGRVPRRLLRDSSTVEVRAFWMAWRCSAMRSKEWMSDLMLKFVTVELIRKARSSSRRTIVMDSVYFLQDHVLGC